jgi:myo-inositol-1(or 4)-monophosphatase
MSSNSFADRYELACAIARDAGALARRMFVSRAAGSFELKGDQDYLTEADGEVERLISERINAAYPADSVLGEEGGGNVGESAWIIDPIDGTANFARGNPHFCISIAYLRDGDPAIGVIYSPVLDELYAAQRGGGAVLNGTAIHVSDTADMRRATIELGWSTRRPLADYTAMVHRTFAAGAGVLRSGSGALGMAYVAAGRTDGYGELHINAWDVLAGLLIVREAGGWTNDFLAQNGLAGGNPILGCTPALRSALTQVTGIGLA